jgi:hypothetical protein
MKERKMTKATKLKIGRKALPAKMPVAEGAVPAPAAAEKRRPGRPAGSLNKATLAIREAIACVYHRLQDEHPGEGDHSHFFEVAKQYPIEFYRLAARLIPLQVEIDAPAIGVVVFRGIND